MAFWVGETSESECTRKSLCRNLCRNPAIPTGIWPYHGVSHGHRRGAANMRRTCINTAPRAHSGFLGVAPSRIGARDRTAEVVGSSPTSSTINSIACSRRLSQSRPISSQLNFSASSLVDYLYTDQPVQCPALQRLDMLIVLVAGGAEAGVAHQALAFFRVHAVQPEPLVETAAHHQPVHFHAQLLGRGLDFRVAGPD